MICLNGTLLAQVSTPVDTSNRYQSFGHIKRPNASKTSSVPPNTTEMPAAPVVPVIPEIPPAGKKEDDASPALSNAYLFLNKMMDLYSSGPTHRLVQSFVPTAKIKDLKGIGYTYDNALVMIAYIKRGRPDDIVRAKILGDTLIDLQNSDASHDGRVRSAYVVNEQKISVDDATTDTGNMAWTGLAFAWLYRSTHDQRYLNAAINIANWIVKNTFSVEGYGGYLGGVDEKNKPMGYASTELNIDAYGLFTLLSSLGAPSPATGGSWEQLGQNAITLIQKMWNPQGNFFWTGTDQSNKQINKDLLPEDVQSWAYLALKSANASTALNWNITTLGVNTGGYSGVSFSAADKGGVWFEGTGQMVAALKLRNAPGDRELANNYLASIERAQSNMLNNDGFGIVAASKDGLDTGDEGDKYFAALHIGATAWYCIGKLGGNPFH